jgi:hypothetical protein
MQRHLIFLLVFGSLALASSARGQSTDWYPQSGDSCQAYVAKALDQNRKLISPRKDPAIDRWLSEFESKTGVSDEQFGLGMLMLYCNDHPTLSLGQVPVEDVAKMVDRDAVQRQSEAEAATRKQDQALNTWYQGALQACGTNTACSTVVTSALNHGHACNHGDQQACIDQQRDRSDIDQLNAKGSQDASQGDLQSCLQESNRWVSSYCRDNQGKCPQGVALLYMQRAAQQSRCGFSGIDAPGTPGVDAACLNICMSGKDSGQISMCQAACARTK